MNYPNLEELKRSYELAEARFAVAEDIGFWLAVTIGLLVYEMSDRWWTGVVAFPVSYIIIRYDYRKKYEKAEKVYFDAVNAE